MKNRHSAYASLMASMVIFGTIGLFRRLIPLSSGLIACVRGLLGALVLLLFMLLSKKELSRDILKKNAWLLLLSGAAIGVNWILLFEAYSYTSVSVATLCYYMAPVFVMAVSPFLLGERLTGRKIICLVAALIGMVLVSGILQESAFIGGRGRGILLGLGAAVLYAGVTLMNKRLQTVPAYDRTLLQLFAAGLVVLPYCAKDLGALGECSPLVLLLLLLVAVIHTGFAYVLYFGSLQHLPSQTVAICSYIDPIVALLLSALLLHEPMTISGYVGAVLILGATVFSLDGLFE